MVLSGGRLEHATGVRISVPLPSVIGLSLVVGAIAVIGAGAVGAQVVRTAAAAVGAGMAWHGWRSAQGRERSVRSWIGFAVAAWLITEIGRLAGILVGEPISLDQISVAALGIGAIGTYFSAAHGRIRGVDEIALYLDGAVVFLGVTAAVLVIGSHVETDASALGTLVQASFFVGLLASTFLLHLSTRVPLRFRGQWEILLGLALGAIGYLGLLNTPEPTWRALLQASVAAGALTVGHGGSQWSATEDQRRGYALVAGRVRALLPLGSGLLTIVVAISLRQGPAQFDALWVGTRAAIALVVVLTIVRQSLLLFDRERVIRRERELTDELTVAEAQYRSVVERVPGVVYVAEAGQHGRWHFVSPKIADLLGYTAEEWTADPTLWLSRLHPADRERMLIAELDDQERVDSKGRGEYRLIARDGRVVWVIDDEAVIARDPDGRPTMVQGILVDISDRKDLEDQLRHQALHDPLTGLPNRVLFVDRLSHALLRAARAQTGVAVLFADLDDFKAVNDTLGHAAGDEVLRMVAARLSSTLRAADTACRLGGDEFAFLIEDAPADRADEIAARILHALDEPFELNGRSVSLTASIGIATHDGVGDSGRAAESADELLRDADTAMYTSKSLGKGRVRVFDRSMEEPTGRPRELRSALERALETDELLHEYQPIVDLRNGATQGLEALVRWNHPQLGRLMPGDFVPLAERTSLIERLGEWVLRRACADLALGTSIVSVNVSAHQLGSGELPALVDEVLKRSGLRPSRLLLELTESTLASGGHGAEVELERIKELGVRIALDDFGSGYSSLEYLGRLPIDVLKIDRSLIERVHLEPQRQEVLRAIGHIAEKLELETIVEGVEHEAQRATLLELGFRQAQGFLFSRPVPLTSLAELRAS